MNLSILRTGPFEVNTCVVTLGGPCCFITDPAACSFSGDSGAIVSYLKKNGLVPVAVFLTHGHFDHVCGLKEIKEAFPFVKTGIHEADSRLVGKDSAVEQGKSLSLMGMEELLPEVTGLPECDFFVHEGNSFAEDFNFSLPEIAEQYERQVKDSLKDWRTFHTPGHTKGSVCYYNEKEKVLLCGDTIFYHSWGRTDLPGGNEGEIQKSLKKIYGIVPGDVKVFPGHGGAGFMLSENY